jgi:hypothetical protein
MNSKRLHLILLSVIGLLLVGLIAGAYQVNSMVGKESNKLSTLKAKDKALSQQQTGLKIAKKGLTQYSELEQIAHTIVPEDKSQAETVRQLSNIASNNGITLASINFPASTLGAVAAAAASSGSTQAATPAPAPAASTKTSQLTPVKNIPGVYQLPITIVSDSKLSATYPRFIKFLADLENNRRTAQVTNIAITPDPNISGNISFSLTLNEYIKP